MTGTKRRRPIVAIVAAVVGGLILLWPPIGRLFIDVPHTLGDNVLAAAFTVGACLAFASAGFARRRPLAAGVLASLAVLPALGLFAPLFRDLLEEPQALLESPFFGGVIILGLVASVLLFAGPCVLAAILDFRRWDREWQQGPVTVGTGGDEGSE